MTHIPHIFIAYAREDAPFLEKLRLHLNILERNCHCNIFYDGEIIPGERWDERLKHELHLANIFVLLVSADFLDSDYVNEVELPKALEREKNGNAAVVPVILRDCLWETTELRDFQVVLKDGDPIAPSDAFAHAAREIFRVVTLRTHTLNLLRHKEEKLFGKPKNPKESKPAKPKKGKKGKSRETDDPFHPLMVFIPGGSFEMGDTFGGGDDREKPVHWVIIRNFHLCKYPVTKAQWRKIMGNNPSLFQGSDQSPVENISWEDTQYFIQKLNAQTGKKYRLPTESEWEYAAKGGLQSRGFLYAGGNDPGTVGWFSDNSAQKTHPVGQKAPNELGFYDMSGNIWEWCEDTWHDTYDGAPGDGSAWTIGDYPNRQVVRGGAWNFKEYFCRSSFRLWFNADQDNYSVGLRLARD